MNFKFLFLCSFGSMSFAASAQLGDIYSIGRSAAEGMAGKKQSKLFTKHLVVAAVCNDTLSILRVPDDKVKGRSAPFILKAQRDLEHARGQCAKDEPIDIDRLALDLYNIESIDTEWEVELYRPEFRKYEAYMDHRRELELQRAQR